MGLTDYYQIGWADRPDGIPCRACGAIAEEGEDHTEWCPIGIADAEAEAVLDGELHRCPTCDQVGDHLNHCPVEKGRSHHAAA